MLLRGGAGVPGAHILLTPQLLLQLTNGRVVDVAAAGAEGAKEEAADAAATALAMQGVGEGTGNMVSSGTTIEWNLYFIANVCMELSLLRWYG